MKEYFKGQLSNSLLTIADKNLMQSFLKDKIHSLLAAFFLLLFLKYLEQQSQCQHALGFLSAGSIVDKFLNVLDFSKLLFLKKRPMMANNKSFKDKSQERND